MCLRRASQVLDVLAMVMLLVTVAYVELVFGELLSVATRVLGGTMVMVFMSVQWWHLRATIQSCAGR